MGREVALLVLVGFFANAVALPLANFFPFGPSNGDSGLPPSDDASDLVQLAEPITFYGRQREYVRVSTGKVSVYIQLSYSTKWGLLIYKYMLIDIYKYYSSVSK